jgi:hypothetical protein
MDILREPIRGVAAWTGAELAQDRSWERQITADERTELEAELTRLKSKGLTAFQAVDRSAITAGSALRGLARDITEAVKDGRGFVVAGGFPVEGHSDDEVRMMFWRLGLELGTPVSQDRDCTLIADVKERHVQAPAGTRQYGGMREARLHVDLTDVVGLLCVRQAPSSPLSTMASAATLYNTIMAEHPDWLPRLYEGFQWDRMSEQAEGEAPVMPWKIPVFSYAGGQLSSRYHRGWIRAGAARQGAPLSEDEGAMLDYIDKTLAANALPFSMRPGDVYFANNYTVLHGRAAYEEEPDWEEAAKRLLLRLWFNIPNIRSFDDEGTVRFGGIRHGNLGWTSQELAAGQNRTPGAVRVFCEAQ